MIEFRDVTFRYPGSDIDVLRNLSFRIPGKGVTAMMGANGSGKSTSALLMNGILTPASGVVEVDSVPTTEWNPQSDLRRLVGVVFQDPNLQFTSMTVEREIAFGLENAKIPFDLMRGSVEEFLGRFDLSGIRDQSPASLSGGEKQRVALASVAVSCPHYLVLDEATTLLSPRARRKLLADAIAEAGSRESALVLITQFPDEALLADHVVIIGNGAVVLQGGPEVLAASAAELIRLGVPVSLRDRLIADEY
ncbi:MAG: ATP-binding cassette domain-containing protein [Ignavibacteria bacterium]|nr:ATP-binding cassette domain-containing protein [Ignavibacteria bacterium]